MSLEKFDLCKVPQMIEVKLHRTSDVIILNLVFTWVRMGWVPA